MILRAKKQSRIENPLDPFDLDYDIDNPLKPKDPSDNAPEPPSYKK